MSNVLHFQAANVLTFSGSVLNQNAKRTGKSDCLCIKVVKVGCISINNLYLFTVITVHHVKVIVVL